MHRSALILVVASLAAGCAAEGAMPAGGERSGEAGAKPGAEGKAVPAQPRLPFDNVAREPDLISALPPLGGAARRCKGWTLTGALFRTNSDVLAPAAYEDLKRLIVRIRRQRRPVAIVGHADERATTFPGGNHGLSLARARAVRRALVRDLGLRRWRIARVRGRGASQPVDPGSSTKAYRVNRRVEIVLRCARD